MQTIWIIDDDAAIGDLEQEHVGNLLAQLLVDATRCGCLLHVYSLRATCSMR